MKKSIKILLLVIVAVSACVNTYKEFNTNHRGLPHSSYCSAKKGCYPEDCISPIEYPSSIKEASLAIIPMALCGILILMVTAYLKGPIVEKPISLLEITMVIALSPLLIAIVFSIYSIL